jgi:hypothetical protein
MIAVNVIHMDVKDIWVELAFSIVEKWRSSILCSDIIAAWFSCIFEINLIDMQLRIIATHNKVVVVLELKLENKD